MLEHAQEHDTGDAGRGGCPQGGGVLGDAALARSVGRDEHERPGALPRPLQPRRVVEVSGADDRRGAGEVVRRPARGDDVGALAEEVVDDAAADVAAGARDGDGGCVQRTSQLRRALPDLAAKVLTQTLRSLEQDGLVERTIRSVSPPHVEYRLAPLGHSLMAAPGVLTTWAEEHIGEMREARARAQRPGRRGFSRAPTTPTPPDLAPSAQDVRWPSNPASRPARPAPRQGRRPRRRTPGMGASEATIVDAGGRELRVTSGDRVIFPETERTAAVTKLDIVRYYLAVEDGIMRALARRPTTLERWPKGVHPGIVLSTRERSGGDAFFQKRIPRGAPDYVRTARIQFPSGRHADEICPTEVAVVGWAAQMGTITFHPWPVREDDVDHPDELRIDLDPQPGTDFADAVRVAGTARALLDDLGYVGFPKTSGGRGIHIYVRIEPRWSFTDVRHAAIAFGRELERRLPGEVTTNWWKEQRGERIFVDYNQNARDRTIASAYSIRPSRERPSPPRSPGTSSPRSRPRTSPWRRCPRASPRWATGTRDRRRRPLAAAPARDVRARRGRGAARTCPIRRTIRRCPGEPKRVQPSRDRDRPRD
jgi:DNA ligase D-like protein (predicted polymerase)